MPGARIFRGQWATKCETIAPSCRVSLDAPERRVEDVAIHLRRAVVGQHDDQRVLELTESPRRGRRCARRSDRPTRASPAYVAMSDGSRSRQALALLEDLTNEPSHLGIVELPSGIDQTPPREGARLERGERRAASPHCRRFPRDARHRPPGPRAACAARCRKRTGRSACRDAFARARRNRSRSRVKASVAYRSPSGDCRTS